MYAIARHRLAITRRPVAARTAAGTLRHEGDRSEVLEHRPEAASSARRTTQAVMKRWRVGTDTTESVTLIVSELVTNAIEHADPPLALHLRRETQGGAIWVGVTDGGQADSEGTWTISCAEDEHGRGLTIIGTLADSHGTHTHRNGATTHWARLTT